MALQRVDYAPDEAIVTPLAGAASVGSGDSAFAVIYAAPALFFAPRPQRNPALLCYSASIFWLCLSSTTAPTSRSTTANLQASMSLAAASGQAHQRGCLSG